MKKLKIFLVALLVLALGIILLARKPADFSAHPAWGVAFSKIFSTQMGLNWRENYLAVLDDLGAKKIRLPVYWPDVESQEGKYDFSDYDWMMSEAQKRNAQIILVVGRKLPRWPECHAPFWADNLPENEKELKIKDFMSATVKRYKDSSALYLWQVDNEPFLGFGECPTTPATFLDQEIQTTRELDPSHKILVTDSGELGFWLPAAKRGDIFGTTMYRVTYNDLYGYYKYPLPPQFYWLKANIVHLFDHQKPIVVSELQAEPWGPKMIYDLPLDEQNKSMSFSQFNENIEYARQTGFSEVYLWGTEWWYWLKVKHNNPEFWDTAKNLININ